MKISANQASALEQLLKTLCDRTEDHPELVGALGTPETATLDSIANTTLDLLLKLGVRCRTVAVKGSAKTYPVTVATRNRANRLSCPCESGRYGICYHGLLALAELINDPTNQLEDVDVFAGWRESPTAGKVGVLLARRIAGCEQGNHLPVNGFCADCGQPTSQAFRNLAASVARDRADGAFVRAEDDNNPAFGI